MSNFPFTTWTILDKDKNGKPCFLQPVSSLLRFSNISLEEYERLVTFYSEVRMKTRESTSPSLQDELHAKMTVMKKYFPRINYENGKILIQIPGREN